MRKLWRAFVLVAMAGTLLAAEPASHQNLRDRKMRDQQLIVASYRLDVDGVATALRAGADVNARYGHGDEQPFYDGWTLGTPMASDSWTALIAVAESLPYPDPPRAIKNTSEDRAWAAAEVRKIPARELEQRREKVLVIARILLSHRADIDAADARGATALFASISDKKLELAKLLLRYDAQVNTKTGIYIDGPGDLTPLHEAYWSPELTKLLLEKHADPQAKDTNGKTPADWAKRFQKVR